MEKGQTEEVKASSSTDAQATTSAAATASNSAGSGNGDGGVVMVHGDIFAAPANSVLVHACNCVGSWGAGIALAFKQKYPAAYEVYRSHCESRSNPAGLLGTTLLIEPQLTDPGKHWIACLFASARYGKRVDTPDMILEATDAAFEHMVNQVANVEKGGREIGALHACKINSGRFGVDWERSREVLNKVVREEGNGRTVTVYEFEEVAPTKKRSSIRAKAAARTASSNTTTSFAELGAAFNETEDATSTAGLTYQPTKRAKRVAKHSSFLHRVASTGLTNSSGIKKKVRRSRGKEAKTRGKLVTSLSSLADALPDFEGFGDDADYEDIETDEVQAGNKTIGIPGLSDVNITIARTRSGNLAQAGVPKKMKSLGTKRGMKKKKEKLEVAERERFQKNAAVIMADQKFGFGSAEKTNEGATAVSTGEAASSGGAASGLQALRAFIHRNMAIQKAL
ncbi:hypothetical protein H072_3787 [Dactylellina haptotyla CBS 200.50]|uniref:ADP-ribose 1''-phosphate phosphatase n=1 Tax=Dactylellina haptotyla (strain CBS 200.50) TaxID=1284197 RepID=S8AGR4_DACHA|nr:hypothetical protein H072_3787 [Dactylellina haptotyla CBS 200.50]